MSRKITIRVADARRSACGFIDAWHAARRRRAGEVADECLVFENLETLLRALTPRRWALLKALRQEGPMSVRALAATLGRDYKNVHADVKALEILGLIDRSEDGKARVPWETLVAEMRLAV